MTNVQQNTELLSLAVKLRPLKEIIQRHESFVLNRLPLQNHVVIRFANTVLMALHVERRAVSKGQNSDGQTVLYIKLYFVCSPSNHETDTKKRGTRARRGSYCNELVKVPRSSEFIKITRKKRIKLLIHYEHFMNKSDYLRLSVLLFTITPNNSYCLEHYSFRVKKEAQSLVEITFFIIKVCYTNIATRRS